MKVEKMDSQNNENRGNQFKVKIRLTTKLILLTVLTLAAAVITLGVLVVNAGAAIIAEGTEADASGYAVEAASHIGAVISGNLETLTELALREQITGMDFNSQVASIAGDVDRLGYQDIAVLNLNGHGKYVVSGGEFDIPNEIWYQEALKGNPGMSDVIISQITKQPSVFEVVPIKKDNQIVGVLLGRRDPTFLKEITNALGDGKNKYGFVLSADGAMMAHPNDELILNQTNINQEIKNNGPLKSLGLAVNEIAKGQTGHMVYEYNGQIKLAYVAPIPETDWTLVITESQDAILAPIVQLRNTIIMFALAILAAGAIISYIISKRIAKPVIEANHMIKELNAGHLSQRQAITSQDEVGEMTDSLNQLADTFQYGIIGLMKKISDGDVSSIIEVTDPTNQVTPVLKQTVETIRALIDETTRLSNAALAGKLETRGNQSAFKGGYREIIDGINETLDAVVGPLGVAANYVERISKGDIPPKITDSYQGDFNEIKNNLNTCIDAIHALVEDAAMLEKAGIEGLLDTRANASRHGGDFAKIVQGVNNTLDAVVGPLNMAATYVDQISKGNIPDKITDSYNGDFNEIKNNLNTCIDAVNGLVDDATMLAQAGIEGQLETRADSSRHQGDFAKIVDGVNATLDAVVAPIQEASAILKELAQGNLNTGMVGNYNGDYTQIKDDMNLTVSFLKRYVDEITQTLNEMGQGNLDLEITSDYLGDFQAIKSALNEITANLSTTMSEINEAAGQVEAGAIQISDGGQALSQGTTEQASSIQELTASMEEVAAETMRNAKNANNANELAAEVKTNAEVGNGQMAQMVSAMVEINEASSNISKIIKVIDDIAFQTNILALNAAVEAARAGQHGKGFAVVAEEVRTLAARSADAAKETTVLIEGSISKTEAGSKIAGQTADSLKEILNQIGKVTNLVGDIARASNDQASEIAQINQGIEQVSQVVQTNSATAEQSAAASEELSGQAEILKQMVGAFRLKGKHSASRMRTVAQPAPKQVKTTSPQIDIFMGDNEIDKY